MLIKSFAAAAVVFSAGISAASADLITYDFSATLVEKSVKGNVRQPPGFFPDFSSYTDNSTTATGSFVYDNSTGKVTSPITFVLPGTSLSFSPFLFDGFSTSNGALTVEYDSGASSRTGRVPVGGGYVGDEQFYLLLRSYPQKAQSIPKTLSLSDFNNSHIEYVYEDGTVARNGDFVPENSESLYFQLTSLQVASAVPEPATWCLMIFGFLGIGVVTHRRRKCCGYAA
jgi:hypothetical protein